MSLTIDELAMPESVDGPGAAEFLAYAALRNAVEAHTLGTGLLAMGPREMLSEYITTPTRLRRHLAARDRDELVGRALVTTRPQTPETGAHLMVDVAPDRRREGIGAALLGAAEGLAIEGGAPVLKVAVVHGVRAGGDHISPRTGVGDLPADDDGARFLVAHGYVLEQVVRISLLDVADTTERVAALGVESQGRAGDDYRVLTWTGSTPSEWVAQVAGLRTRMSTDAPMGGLVMVADPWDAERIREHDDRIASSGREIVTAAVEHVRSGTLAGFTEIIASGDDPLGVQEDTLVLREHRGHRLGALLKSANVRQLVAVRPDVEAVVTWNAEENRPMLDVNEAMGFREIGREGGWQKRL
jgi:GNAT superfamily N-acetyltransferase